MSISAGAGTALAAGIGAVANMIGIGAGTAMTRKGIKLQHKNNLSAMQYQGELQDYYNKKYWDMYNSPEAQMRALREGGLNPYNNNIQTGGVNSQGVSALGSQVPDMGAGVREGMANVGNIASNAMSTYTQMQQTESMVQLQSAQSKEILDTLDFVIDKLKSEAKNNYKDVELKDAKTNAQLLYNTILSSTMNSQIEAYKLQNEYTRSQIALNNVNFEIQAKVSQYFDINQRMEIMKGISQLLNDEKNRSLSDAQIKKLASDAVVNYANARKINIDARIAEETAEAYIKAQNYSNGIIAFANGYDPDNPKLWHQLGRGVYKNRLRNLNLDTEFARRKHHAQSQGGGYYGMAVDMAYNFDMFNRLIGWY